MKKGDMGRFASMMIAIVVTSVFIFAGVFRGVFVSETKAVNALTTAGYSDVVIVDKAWFCIGLRGGENSDAVRFKAKALNPAGKPAEVYVFIGWPFKGATIRGL